jgi:DNA polymerase-1
MKSKERPSRFLIVDALGLAYRSFYAIRGLTGPNGEATNAVYGFLRSVRMYLERFQPSHIAIVFDAGIPAERSELLAEYKAQRAPMPDSLRAQLPKIERISEAFGWKAAALDGWEADDVIASLAEKSCGIVDEVLIITADKDILQLVTERIKAAGFGKTDAPLDAHAVREKMGVAPEEIVDYLALLGDQSDNIPGVPGVGKQTARQLINEHGSVDGIYRNIERVHPPRIRSSLIEARERVRMNRELIKLRSDLEVPWDTRQFEHSGPPDWDDLIEELRGQGFQKMVHELQTQEELPF